MMVVLSRRHKYTKRLYVTFELAWKSNMVNFVAIVTKIFDQPRALRRFSSFV